MTASNKLLESLTQEFVETISQLPSVRRKRKISSADIRSAANTIKWEHSLPSCDNATEPSSTSSTISRDDLLELSTTPTVVQNVSPLRLSVSVHAPQAWKLTAHTQATAKASSTVGGEVALTNRESLPEGLKEFLRQVELEYSPDRSSGCVTLSKADVVEAVSTSPHLWLVFPFILKVCVNLVRTATTSLDPSKFLPVLQLMSGMIANPHYTMSSANSADFDLALNCLVDIIVRLRPTLGEIRDSAVGEKSVDVLILLLKEKVGKSHATSLVRDLVSKVFVPVLTKLMDINPSTPDAIESFENCFLAVRRLSAEFEIKHESEISMKKFETFAKKIQPKV